MSHQNEFKTLFPPSMSGNYQLYQSISSTPTSGSPVDIFSSGLFDDYEDTSSDGRSRRPSDETDNGFHLPEFRRAVGSIPTASPVPVIHDPESLNTLQQAVSVFRAMNLGDSNSLASSVIESNVALANLTALAQINQIVEPQRTIKGNFYSRQVSVPVETLFPPPSHPYNRVPTMNGHHQTNYGWNNAFQQMPNVGFTPMNSYGYNRPSFNHSISLPMGNPEMSKMTGLTESVDMMEMRTKFGSLGTNPGMFNAPHGFCTGCHEEIIVADTNNHRIQIFDKRGNFRFLFGEPGKEEGCLWYPRKVAVLEYNGFFVVCDRGLERSRMQLFNEHGMFVRRINIRFVDIVAGIAITANGLIVLIDSVRPTLFIINPANGELVTFFECAEFMTEPSDVAVYNNEFYICDFKGHSVVVLGSDGKFVRKISTQGVSLFPNGIDISDAGDVLVGDSHGNQFHVAIFNRNGEFVSHFQCPQVKVSRCCGLKITSEGYIITLAKNNHHVLVLNTLFVS